MTSVPRLTIQNLRVRMVHVPMPLPLQTSSGTIGTAPLALIDLYTEEGVTGCAYLFCYTPLVLKPVAQFIANLTPRIKGDGVAAPSGTMSF
jgi:mandelate racemase